MVLHNPLTKSIAVVAVFWWIVLSIAAVATHPGLFTSLGGITATSKYSLLAVLALLTGAAAGIALVLSQKVQARVAKDRGLIGAGRLGMQCTLGQMPVTTTVALQAKGPVPSWFFDRDVVEHGPALQSWLVLASKTHPVHAEALLACIRVLCQFPDLPASHVPNGHGGRSLVDHSARVAALSIEEAKHFRYAGLVSPYGREPWGDPGYDFDSTDPMIPLIGFAHDIGKLATFVLNAQGNVTASRPNHDMIGSRLLATMEQIKALPARDQGAMHRAISFYHHPSGYPMNAKGRIGDDRAVALMMLLIKADKRAGKEEAGQSLSPDQYAAYLNYMKDLGQELDKDEQAIVNAATSTKSAVVGASSALHRNDEVQTAILKILLDPMQVMTANPQGKDSQMAVGQLMNTSYPQWAWDWKASGQEFDEDAANRLSDSIERVIVLNEVKFRLALAKRLGMGELIKKGDGRYQLTIQALRVLYEMGVLYTETDEGNVSPESALYVVQIQRNNDGSELAQWKSAIVLKPIASLGTFATTTIHPSLAKIVRPIWKDRRMKTGSTTTTGDESIEDASHQQIDEEYIVDTTIAPAIDTAADSMVDLGNDDVGSPRPDESEKQVKPDRHDSAPVISEKIQERKKPDEQQLKLHIPQPEPGQDARDDRTAHTSSASASTSITPQKVEVGTTATQALIEAATRQAAQNVAKQGYAELYAAKKRDEGDTPNKQKPGFRSR